MGARVHHHDVIPSEKKNPSVLEDAHAIVRDAVKHQNPVGALLCGAHFPSTKQNAVGGAYVEFFFLGADLTKSGIRFRDEVGRERPSNRTKE